MSARRMSLTLLIWAFTLSSCVGHMDRIPADDGQGTDGKPTLPAHDDSQDAIRLSRGQVLAEIEANTERRAEIGEAIVDLIHRYDDTFCRILPSGARQCLPSVPIAGPIEDPSHPGLSATRSAIQDDIAALKAERTKLESRLVALQKMAASLGVDPALQHDNHIHDNLPIPPMANGSKDKPGPRPDPAPSQRGAARPASSEATSAADPCAGLGDLNLNCVDYDAIVDKLRSGLAEFKAPPTMIMGKETAVGFAISMEASQPTGKAPTSVDIAISDVDGHKTVFTTKIARDMSAQLIGTGFKITPAGPIRNSLSRLQPASWRWTVTPLRAGRQVLQLQTFVHLSLADGSTRDSALPVETRQINVTVAEQPIGTWFEQCLAFLKSAIDTAKDMITSLTGLVTAVLALGAAIGLRESRKRRKRRSGVRSRRA